MGLFAKLFGSKEGREEPKKEEDSKQDFSPKDKKMEWFLSETGLQSCAEYTSPKNYLLEETIRKEFKNKLESGDLPNLEDDESSFSIFVRVYHKEAKIPTQYLENFVSCLKSKTDVLDYVGPNKFLVAAYKLLAETVTYDSDGEPQTHEPVLSPKELLSVESNIMTKFVQSFDLFNLEDDASGSWDDKYEIWKKAIMYLFHLTTKKVTNLDADQWLFEKSTYFNDLGTVRKLKGFLNKGLECASDKDYFEGEIKELEVK